MAAMLVMTVFPAVMVAVIMPMRIRLTLRIVRDRRCSTALIARAGPAAALRSTVARVENVAVRVDHATIGIDDSAIARMTDDRVVRQLFVTHVIGDDNGCRDG